MYSETLTRHEVEVGRRWLLVKNWSHTTTLNSLVEEFGSIAEGQCGER